MYKELIERLSNLLQSYAAYTDPDLAHALEEAMIAISTLIAKNTKLANRCAAYEDTGLEPEEIEKLCDMDRRAKMAEMLRDEEKNGISTDCLRELVQADRDGRCVVLPCKVGDIVYLVNHHLGRIFENEVSNFLVGYESDNRNTINTVYIGKFGGKTFRKWKFQQIGKTVFLTREEAEKALRRKQDDEKHHIL